MLSLLSITSGVKADDKPAVEEYNIEALLTQAESRWDLSEEDAIILLDAETIEWTKDHRLLKFAHRIVWINSENALERFIGEGVPHHEELQVLSIRNAAIRSRKHLEQNLEPEDLNVISKRISAEPHLESFLNAKIECVTEFPCVIDFAYILEDASPFRTGVDGIWLAHKEYPCLIASLTLSRRDGADFRINSQDLDLIHEDTEDQLISTYTIMLEDVPAISRPLTSDPAFFTPHVTWATWNSWQELGENIKSAFNRNLEINRSMRDSLDMIISRSFAMTDRAKNISSFIDRSVKYTDLPDEAWYFAINDPRQSFERGSAGRFDRAIYAATLFKEAGFVVFPFLRGAGFEDVNEGVPTLDRMDGISVWISGSEQVEAYYDPVHSKLCNGLTPIFGRSIWFPGQGEDPVVSWQGKGTNSSVSISLDLTLDPASCCWKGKGYFTANQGMNPFEELEGLDNFTEDYLQRLISSLLTNAELTGFNPVAFNRFNTSMGMEFSVGFGDEAEGGVYTLELGDPVGGLIDRISEDVEIDKTDRGSPVSLAGLMATEIRLRIFTDGVNIIDMPKSTRVSNRTGLFELTVKRDDSALVIERSLMLKKANFDASEWRALRKVLKADIETGNRTVRYELNDN